MIPLRYVKIDALDRPPTPQRGTVMELERAVILFLLEPETEYGPNDIATLALTWELQQGPLNSDDSKKLNRFRTAYRQLAETHLSRCNANLSGREWADMVVAARPAVAEFMAELTAAQAAQPDVIFTLHEGNLIPYPDQRASTAPPLPPRLGAQIRIIHFPVAEAPTAPPLAVPAEEQTTALPDNAVNAANRSDSLPPEPTPSTRRWAWRPRLGRVRIALLALMLPTLLFAYFWSQVDDITLADIEEMGAPFQEIPHLIAAGQRYEPGDWVRFEGKIGMIKKISREEIIVGDRTYEAPPLYFFGMPMNVSGNYVVYPGSYRHIAGNFWLDHSNALDTLPLGTLSWVGGFFGFEFLEVNFQDVASFIEQVLGVTILSTDGYRITLPEGIQPDDLLTDCESMGATVTHDSNSIEVEWP